MREQINLYISFDTTFEDIELLRKEMQDFVLAKENAREYQPEVDIEVIDLAEMNKLQLRIEIRHKGNWAIESIRAARRSKFMCALVQALRKVPIYGPGGGNPAAGDKANPTYSVSITDAEARENKEQYNMDKDAKRLVPTAKDDKSAGASSSIDFFGDSSVEARERAQAQALNQRRVVVDPSGQGREDLIPSALDRQKATHLDEVKDIMRRQSTLGRRKATQTAETIQERPSGTQTQTQTQSSNLAVSQSTPVIPSYYEDNSFVQPSASAAPAIHVSSASQSSVPRPAPLQTQQAGRFRSDSNAVTPTSYEGVPGNAFAMQQHLQQQQQREQSSPPRRPVPGMSQMKDHLQQGPSDTQGGQR